MRLAIVAAIALVLGCNSDGGGGQSALKQPGEPCTDHVECANDGACFRWAWETSGTCALRCVDGSGHDLQRCPDLYTECTSPCPVRDGGVGGGTSDCLQWRVRYCLAGVTSSFGCKQEIAPDHTWWVCHQ
jgi:hypothetical protein